MFEDTLDALFRQSPDIGLLATATTVALWSLGIVDDPFRFLQNLDPGKWLGTG
jgi:hypothetical protein